MGRHAELRSALLHGEVTHEILGCAFDVAGEQGAGFVESVYERSLAVALAEKGLDVVAQRPLAVSFRGRIVGEFIADLVVNGCVIIELKAVKALAPEHEAQVVNYLKATDIEVGLLINFGNPKLEYRRFTRTRDHTSVEQQANNGSVS
ncbi:MAG: GxxExxY protein [Anaerolineae bacterium]